MSSTILGATQKSQLVENFKALDVLEKLTPARLVKIETVMQNKPAAAPF